MNEAVSAAMVNLSIVIITKNEEENLRRLLPVIHGLGEILVYDSGSSDGSEAVARQYGADFVRDAHWQGFGKQRQKAQQLCRGRWILMLDADEVPDATMLAAIKSISGEAPGQTIYGLRRIDHIFGHAIDYAGNHLKAHWRLYPRSFSYDDALVHEALVLNGAPTAVLAGYVNHYMAKSPQQWLAKRLNYAERWAAERAGRQRSNFWRICGHTVGAFLKQYFIDRRFLCGRYGLIYSHLFAQYTFNKYALLYDRNRRPDSYRADYQPHGPVQPRPVSLKNHRHSLSVVLITKNEERQLAQCLDSLVDIADEIVVLDSGSTDRTLEIARAFGARCFTNQDWQGFGIQRQRAQALAVCDYVLMIDADERLDERLRQSIERVLERPPRPDVVYGLKRFNIFCGRRVHWRYGDLLARLYPRQHFQFHPYEVHESLNQGTAKLIPLAGALNHYTNDNLLHFMQKNLRYSETWARERPRKNISLWWLGGRANLSFLREYLLRGAWFGGIYGFFLAMVSHSYTFNKYLINHEKSGQD